MRVNKLGASRSLSSNEDIEHIEQYNTLKLHRYIEKLSCFILFCLKSLQSKELSDEHCSESKSLKSETKR
ncbi:Uncharacterized protein DAT39_005362 [Clarias magur]|uniref:Uncharacterized protein n=1 Tax=Clarias magur TaxID=1594786 RepID=A0A8J4XDQ9_CLAMG|nr:Uncharacterized protein DAT39_005362 [Clarias magur]